MTAKLITLFAMNSCERDMVSNDYPLNESLYKYVFESEDKNKHTLFIDKTKMRSPQVTLYNDFNRFQIIF